MNKSLETQLHEVNARFDESSSHVSDLESTRDRLTSENGDLAQQLEEAESQMAQLSKQKQSLARQLEEIKGSLEEETRMRMKLQSDSRNLQVRRPVRFDTCTLVYFMVMFDRLSLTSCTTSVRRRWRVARRCRGRFPKHTPRHR